MKVARNALAALVAVILSAAPCPTRGSNARAVTPSPSAATPGVVGPPCAHPGSSTTPTTLARMAVGQAGYVQYWAMWEDAYRRLWAQSLRQGHRAHRGRLGHVRGTRGQRRSRLARSGGALHAGGLGALHGPGGHTVHPCRQDRPTEVTPGDRESQTSGLRLPHRPSGNPRQARSVKKTHQGGDRRPPDARLLLRPHAGSRGAVGDALDFPSRSRPLVEHRRPPRRCRATALIRVPAHASSSRGECVPMRARSASSYDCPRRGGAAEREAAARREPEMRAAWSRPDALTGPSGRSPSPARSGEGTVRRRFRPLLRRGRDRRNSLGRWSRHGTHGRGQRCGYRSRGGFGCRARTRSFDRCG